MSDPRETVTQLADFMDEFGLSEASLTQDGVFVRFSRKKSQVVVSTRSEGDPVPEEIEEAIPAVPAVAVVPAGTPINSPMNGIFYNAPSPGSPPFVKVGDSVSAGQVIGLIEAMKVFNEVPSPISGTVLSVVADSGAVVQLGEAIMMIG
jgi:acetyl-CoA carboxylase biotin carboxyl carrier protein